MRRRHLLCCGGLALVRPGLLHAAKAAPLVLGLLQQAGDERLAPHRLAQAYPGQPGGTLQAAVELAAEGSRFELDAAGLRAKVEVRSAGTPDEARDALRALASAGAIGVVLDLPAAWLATVVPAAPLAQLNAGEAAESARRSGCWPQLFHTLPGERMRADALAQALANRGWRKVLLLAGSRPEDAARLLLVQAALKRHGLQVVAQRPFRLSADPRERELGNLRLLTGPAVAADYDVVWVVDSDGEFARSLPYGTVLPRPVVGDGGLTAEAWMPRFDRYGAPQLSRRFATTAGRPMTGADWAAYVAGRALLQAALPDGPRASAVTAERVLKALSDPGFTLDASKGVQLSFRAWDHQLRQPLLLTDGQGLIGLAPMDGVMHPRQVLDTLGSDAPESACRLDQRAVPRSG